MWGNTRRVFSIVSIMVGAIATAVPDELWSKVLFAIALGCSNVAIFIKGDTEPAEDS